MRRRLCLAGASCLALPAAAATGMGGAFTLTAGDGTVVTDRQFRGRFMLLFFGYTNCPDQCPLALSAVAQALAMMGARAADIAALFVTIDPARDTPALTARYAALFSPHITGLSGTPAQIAGIIAAYHVYVGPPDPRTGAIAHGDLLYLTSPNGTFISVIPAQLSPRTLAQTLTRRME